MTKILVNEANSYEVLIGRDILTNNLDDTLDFYKNVIFFIDQNCPIKIDGAIYIDPSEENKSLQTYYELIELLLIMNVPRIDTAFCAIGGGIVLDIVGYIAATYKRGIDLIYVPSTLLAQVDVAIGSKNGVNVRGIKNQVGTFYSPKKVFIDTSFLDSLDQREINNAMAEVIKAGILFDLSLLSELEKTHLEYETIIYKSLMVKKHFIENDPFDESIRRYLNFGHTYGHAIEALCDDIKHGEAISIGMNLMLDNKRLKVLCKKFNLPTEFKEDIAILDQYLKNDKKNTTNNVNFVTINQIGDYRV